MSKLALILVAAALFLVGCGESEDSNGDRSQQQARAQQQAERYRAEVRRAKMRQRARAAARRHQRQLVARGHRAQVRAEEAERRASEEAAADEVAAEEEASECDPNYSGACLDPYASDYDCEGGSGDGPEYTGLVTVVGEDHYGLDADSDGTGCEPY